MLVMDASPRLSETAIDALRTREFSRLDAANLAYLDYTGAALYADRQITRHLNDLRRGVFGNPHSESAPSRAATATVEDARERVLAFLDADPNEYAVIFTANCSTAIKLVAESYPFSRLSSLVLSTDNHNSMNGVREFAVRQRARVSYVPLDDELRLVDPERFLRSKRRGACLFGFPAQSNFSGVQHPLSLIEAAQTHGFEVLLDAPSFAPSNSLSLRSHRPEFVVLSFYKIFGYPTGVGALVARRDALARLRRPWFAGGTVEFASVQNAMHALKDAPDGFEDGTPNFAMLGALAHGFDLLEEVGMSRVHEHVARLTRVLIDGLLDTQHGGADAVVVYGPRCSAMRGGTISFNLLDRARRTIPYADVERRARDAGIAVRGGCFCNPGAAESAFGFDAARAKACLDTASLEGFTPARLARCLDDGTPVGAIRASVGLGTIERDVERLVTLVGNIVNADKES